MLPSAEHRDSVLAIVGPTGSGKSSLGLSLAERNAGEIVSCDSVQVYRGFEIGCAKPSAEERARIRHHLIDVVEWNEPFDAARYCRMALETIPDIRARGRIPILVGGTGLYLRALRWGLVALPEDATALRRELDAAEQRAPGTSYARLCEVDPESAARIDSRNLVFVMRALEISLATGRPASRVRREHGFRTEQLPMQVVALQHTRDVLRTRIRTRVAAMLEQGFVAEVEGLLGRGVDPRCRPMRSVGYREVCAVLCGEAPHSGLAERIEASTWAYARRQLTWLKRERDVAWLDAGDEREFGRLLVR